MKILIVASSDIVGGAHKAAYRLHRALLTHDIDSQMLVQNKNSDDYTVVGPVIKRQKVLAKAQMLLDPILLTFYKNRTKTYFSSAWAPFSNIVNQINNMNPDIVHLQWINDGMISVEDLAKIKAPIVWTLHDMWPFTGGCHYNEGCEKYENKCGKCKVLVSEKENDLSRKIYIRKQKAFSKKENITIIGLSKWLNTCSKKSSLLKNKKHVNIPNLINTENFKPFDKGQARGLWNLPKSKKLLLFGAMDATSDPRKGFKELSEALQKITNKDIELVIFGSSEPKGNKNLGFKTHYLGKIYDDVSLVTLYSAVDVVLVPSLQENLSNVIMEGLTCATPIVAFNIGGNRDMIEHKINGNLAAENDTEDLANGIEWVLNESDYDELCQNARKKVLTGFSQEIVLEQYLELYKSIINN
jgi:glycosyltransferase involved in cell wall biosynthesis